MKGNRGFVAEIVIGAVIGILSHFLFTTVEELLSRDDLRQDESIFHYLREDGHRLLRLSLRTGSDPDSLNENGNTPLHVVLSQGNPSYRILKTLLRFRADPNFPDPRGATPLHLAARHGNGAIMTALLKAGGDPLIITRGQTETPYDVAVRLGNGGAVGAIERSKKFKRDKKRVKVKRREP